VLAQPTIYGVSSIAAELITSHHLLQGQIESAEPAVSGRDLRYEMLLKYLEADKHLDAEVRHTIGTDFDLSNLNYRTKWFRMIRKRPSFYASAMIVQLITIYQVTGYVPNEASSATVWTTSGGELSYNYSAGICVLPDNATFATSAFDNVHAAPLVVSWAYQPHFLTSLALDDALVRYYSSVDGQGDATCPGVWLGWDDTFCSQLMSQGQNGTGLQRAGATLPPEQHQG